MPPKTAIILSGAQWIGILHVYLLMENEKIPVYNLYCANPDQITLNMIKKLHYNFHQYWLLYISRMGYKQLHLRHKTNPWNSMLLPD